MIFIKPLKKIPEHYSRQHLKGQQRLFSLALCKVQNFCVWTYPNSYILIGCKMKSYLANNKKIWPLGLYEGHKAKKGQKTKWLRIVQFGEKSNKKFFTEQKSHKNLENFCLNGITSLLLSICVYQNYEISFHHVFAMLFLEINKFIIR